MGYESIRTLQALAVAQIARVEVPAALWRKQRLGELSTRHAQILTADFEADYYGTEDEPPRFAPILTTSAILDDAARLCGPTVCGPMTGCSWPAHGQDEMPTVPA